MAGLFQDGIEEYAAAHTSPPPAHLDALFAETQRLLPDRAGMLTGQLEGRFLKLLVSLVQARSVLEIGCFTGYSALSMAEGLGPGGRIVTCEISEEHAAIARRHIAASPYADRIEVRLGPALDTIASLPGPFDFVFIDADKTNYRNYYEAVLPKLSPRGLIAVDNVIWYGRTIDPSVQDEDTVAIRAFNAALASDERVEVVMLTVRDGVTLVRKTGRD